MSKYEIQVLDSYQNDTYADGHAASVYGQYPPPVNACLPPGEWQTFDIVFRRPHFRRDGGLASPARTTLIHNGMLVQDNVALMGPTSWLQHAPYTPHPDKLPLALQDHHNPVRFRNIWIRELPEGEASAPRPAEPDATVRLSANVLERYAGRYRTDEGSEFTITLEVGQMRARFYRPHPIDLVPYSPTEFALRGSAARLVFELRQDGRPQAFALHVGGSTRRVRRADYPRRHDNGLRRQRDRRRKHGLRSGECGGARESGAGQLCLDDPVQGPLSLSKAVSSGCGRRGRADPGAQNQSHAGH
jgi:hypothetical protein